MKTSLLFIATALLLAAVGCDGAKTPAPTPPVVPTSAPATPADKPAVKPTADKPGADESAAKADPKAGLAKPDGKGGLVVTSELYKVKFTVPEKWTVDKSPTGISANSPDKKILMVVAGSASQDLAESALNDLKQNLKFKDVNITKQGTTALNGLIGLRGEGDATIINEDKTEEAVHFVAFTAKLDERAITVLIFSAKGEYEKNIDLIEGILNTMDKMAKG